MESRGNSGPSRQPRSRWWRSARRSGRAARLRGPNFSEWTQITKLPDSVSQPALSPDGRKVTFVRGPETFFGPGQIYVKTLPDGEPVQLTHDSLEKMSPAFSSDGARIAYTTVDSRFGWYTWLVSAAGGEPKQWLRNASAAPPIGAALRSYCFV